MDGEPPEKLQRGIAASFKTTRASERTRSSSQVKMPLSLSSLTLADKKEEFLKLKVLMIHPNYIIAGKDAGDARLMRISKRLCPTDYPIRRGDWLRVKVTTEDDPESEEKLKVLTVNWLETTEGEGAVTAILEDGEYLADNSVLFHGDAITKFAELKVGDKVELVTIASDQGGENVLDRKRRHCGFGTGEAGTYLCRFKKRAVKVTLLEAKAATRVLDEWDEEIDDGSQRSNFQADPKFEQLLRNKNRIRIGSADCVDLGSMVVGSTVTYNLEIENNGRSEVFLRGVKFWMLQNVCMFQAEYDLPEGVQCAIIWPQGSLTVKIHCRAESLGRTKEMCVFDFGSNVRIARWMKVNSISEDAEWVSKSQMPDVKHWREKQAQLAEKTVGMVQDRDRVVLHGPAFFPSTTFQQNQVPSYAVPKVMTEVFHDGNVDLLRSTFPVDFTNLTGNNYLTRFKVSLWLEELENELLRKEYDMNNVVLKREERHLALEVPNFNEIKPPLMRGDKVGCIVNCVDREIYTGTIEKIIWRMHIPMILLRFQGYFHSRYDGSPVHQIHFCSGRTVYIRQHHAIECAVKLLGTDWLFPTAVALKPPRLEVSEAPGNDHLTSKKSPSKQPNPFRQHGLEKSGTEKTDGGMPSFDKRFQLNVQLPPKGKFTIQWFNKSLNVEQKEAVRGILHARARPLPYIIFGPPGTGKTVTLVEGVMQVYFLEATSRILVAVPSNAGADLVAKRLVETQLFQPGDFVRLNGFLRSEDAVLDDIVPFCQDGTQLDVISKYKLIICTTNTAGQFFQLGQNAINFSHVFIDEAGFATEPDALIPCVMAAVEKEAVIIMAGDPYQLGPVLMNDMRINRILQTSLLERLMQTKVYQRDAQSNLFNAHLVTKLVKSYRSHPFLLTVPSILFYGRELVSCAGKDAYEFCDEVNLGFLPNPKQPLVFHGVKGICRRDNDSPSYYNQEEASAIREYVLTLRRHKVQSNDIGIITPYRKQADKISGTLRKVLEVDEMPKVASVQEFQGGEKKVIIISTVRSEYEDAAKHAVASMDFIYSPKLFNVAVTRAKALLIVIGNPDVLCLNPFWGCLLKYSIHHLAYKGCNLDPAWDKKLRAAMEEYNNGCDDSSSEDDDPDASVDDEGGYRHSEPNSGRPFC